MLHSPVLNVLFCDLIETHMISQVWKVLNLFNCSLYETIIVVDKGWVPSVGLQSYLLWLITP